MSGCVESCLFNVGTVTCRKRVVQTEERNTERHTSFLLLRPTQAKCCLQLHLRKVTPNTSRQDAATTAESFGTERQVQSVIDVVPVTKRGSQHKETPPGANWYHWSWRVSVCDDEFQLFCPGLFQRRSRSSWRRWSLWDTKTSLSMRSCAPSCRPASSPSGLKMTAHSRSLLSVELCLLLPRSGHTQTTAPVTPESFTKMTNSLQVISNVSVHQYVQCLFMDEQTVDTLHSCTH